MDIFFKTVTWCGSLIILLPVAAVLGLLVVQRNGIVDVFLIIGGLCGSSFLSHSLKLFFARPRPPAEGLLVDMPSDFSFPSAHTAQIFAFTIACGITFSKQVPAHMVVPLWLALITLAVIVGYSRIYLQVHYGSDVIAGGLLGIGWLFILHRILIFFEA